MLFKVQTCNQWIDKTWELIHRGPPDPGIEPCIAGRSCTVWAAREARCTAEWWFQSTCACAESRQSCPSLCDPTDCSPPGSSVHGILQARALQWVAVPVSSVWWWKCWQRRLMSEPCCRTGMCPDQHWYASDSQGLMSTASQLTAVSWGFPGG